MAARDVIDVMRERENENENENENEEAVVGRASQRDHAGCKTSV